MAQSAASQSVLLRWNICGDFPYSLVLNRQKKKRKTFERIPYDLWFGWSIKEMRAEKNV